MASSFSKLQTRTSFQASQIACLVFSLRTNQRETLTTDNQLNFSEKEPRHEQLITGSWVKHKLKKDKKQKKTNPQNTQKRKEGVQSHSVRSIPLLSAITETVQNQFAEWNRADVRWDGCRTKAFLFCCVWQNRIRVWNMLRSQMDSGAVQEVSMVKSLLWDRLLGVQSCGGFHCVVKSHKEMLSWS